MPDLDLPSLPDGYFYRIRPLTLVGAVIVQVRRRRRMFGSAQVAYSVVWPGDWSSPENAIIAGAADAQAELRKRRSADGASVYYGDHVPRKDSA